MLFIVNWIAEGLVDLVESVSQDLLEEQFQDEIEAGIVEISPVAYA